MGDARNGRRKGTVFVGLIQIWIKVGWAVSRYFRKNGKKETPRISFDRKTARDMV